MPTIGNVCLKVRMSEGLGRELKPINDGHTEMTRRENGSVFCRSVLLVFLVIQLLVQLGERDV